MEEQLQLLMFAMKNAEIDEILATTNVTMEIWIVLMDVMEIATQKEAGFAQEEIPEELNPLLTFALKFVETVLTEDGILAMTET